MRSESLQNGPGEGRKRSDISTDAAGKFPKPRRDLSRFGQAEGQRLKETESLKMPGEGIFEEDISFLE